MTPEDYSGFCSSMKMLSSAFPNWKVTGEDLDAWFQILTDYDLGSLSSAMRAITLDTSRGSFPPTTAEIAGKISGVTQNVSRPHVLNQLDNPTTPIGVLARINVQSIDRLAGGFVLKEAVDRFVDMIPALEKRISERGYKQSELEVFKKYNISPREQFGRSSRTPQTDSLITGQIDRFKAAQPRLENSNHSSEPEEKKLVPADNVARFLEELKSGLEPTPRPKFVPERKPTTCKNPECKTIIGGKYDACPRCETIR